MTRQSWLYLYGEFAPADMNKITCLCEHYAGRHEKEKSQGRHKKIAFVALETQILPQLALACIVECSELCASIYSFYPFV